MASVYLQQYRISFQTWNLIMVYMKFPKKRSLLLFGTNQPFYPNFVPPVVSHACIFLKFFLPFTVLQTNLFKLFKLVWNAPSIFSVYATSGIMIFFKYLFFQKKFGIKFYILKSNRSFSIGWVSRPKAGLKSKKRVWN